MLDEIRDFSLMNTKLKEDLKKASEQLAVQGVDLTNSRTELQMNRLEIDVRYPKISLEKFKVEKICVFCSSSCCSV